MTSDGVSHTVTAVFSADAACTDTETYTAPVSCQCVISNITATPGRVARPIIHIPLRAGDIHQCACWVP
ncbi:MAG: hypothetical protein IPN86_14815 [Saprospiraceae bacterium]|nr:hypothetical protein [Saprospiraceae bacterium]